MWLYNSSIGRKVVMSVSGIALILFLTFHACMNVVALFSADAYNEICEFLGSNWYAVAGTVALVGLIAIHFIYAVILTLQNRKARGNNRYAVTATPDKVDWNSRNMFVLGVIIVLGLLLHLFNFWYNMMFERHADARPRRKDLVQPLESDRQCLCNDRNALLRSRGYPLRFLWRRVLSERFFSFIKHTRK